MKRIYGRYAYGAGPRTGCWWDETAAPVSRPPLTGAERCDVAIIGAGFTGLSAALHLARAGLSVIVLEAERVGWGASGRNGGFCTLGGAKASDKAIERRYGVEGCDDWHRAEIAAVTLAAGLIEELGLDVDRHSRGETKLAHRPCDFEDMKAEAEVIRARRGLEVTLTEARDLAAAGMNGPFHGAMTVNAGFALNPRKYVDGLARGAEAAGALICDGSPVIGMTRERGTRMLRTPQGLVRAARVIVATNGYSSDDLPGWLSDRYIPTQSSVMVTRPMSEAEIAAQGWSSDQMSYDSRHLLHYFRLMPDRRFLIGMRGGLVSSAASEAATRRKVRRDFERMFPAWAHVESQHHWSGFVCISRRGTPFVGEVPGGDGLFAGLCYHGNGVAMGSYAGAVLADLVAHGKTGRVYPALMRDPLARFGLGALRRLVMPPAYAHFWWQDR